MGPDVLMRARSLLRHGETLICYVDNARKVAGSSRPISNISPNIFHLASRTGARLLFLGSRLDPSGAIVISFHLPAVSRPTSTCEADQAATEFAAFASELLGWACVVRRPTKSRLGKSGRGDVVRAFCSPLVAVRGEPDTLDPL